MKKLICTLFLICLVTTLSAQNETAHSKQAVASFEEFYNAASYDSIFGMFSSQMKEALPLSNTTQFLTNLKAQAGKINKREFIKYENGTVALYKTDFENGTLGLYIAADIKGQINGMLVKEYVEESPAPELERNSSKMILPFNGEWTVLWGGDTRELNYHVDYKQQKTAFDLVMTNEKNLSYKTTGQTNDDYYVFGQEIIAPTGGEVVQVVDGVKDNVPGVMNTLYVPGNTVIIKTANDEYLFFAHFKQASIVVKQGQQVQQGDLLGLCGNSGNSSEPHLHFQIQNVENMSQATTAKAFFEEILVNGKVKEDYSPIKGERIKNKE
ncbi:MAG: peptidoglycan DD-metalloendopeptidase family protein [Roseivirga sp.]|nr:peptidoglycan DD-metalloendopeptidase family protein [Roseivirga sp.]